MTKAESNPLLICEATEGKKEPCLAPSLRLAGCGQWCYSFSLCPGIPKIQADHPLLGTGNASGPQRAGPGCYLRVGCHQSCPPHPFEDTIHSWVEVWTEPPTGSSFRWPCYWENSLLIPSGILCAISLFNFLQQRSPSNRYWLFGGGLMSFGLHPLLIYKLS